MPLPPWVIPASCILFATLLICAFIFRKKKSSHYSQDEQDHDQGRDATFSQSNQSSNNKQWSQLSDTRIGDSLLVTARELPTGSLTLRIDQIDRYEQDGDSWNEYSGLHAGCRYALEQADGKYPWICIEDELPLSVLNLSEDQLHEDDLEICDYQGDTFELRDDGDASYYKNGQGSGEDFYSWTLISQNGKQSVSIEAWEGEQPSVAVSLRVDSLSLQRG